jgi:pyridoxine kinase
VALPTVMLSNHPGHPNFSKHDVPGDALVAMIDVYERSGWLKDVDAVLTGYLPSSAHVAAAVYAAGKVRAANSRALIVCDPVLGDDPDGLYIPQDAATALRKALVPMADYITPNRFELEWISQRPVSTQPEAITAARAIAGPAVLVTSLPLTASALGDLLVQPSETTLSAVPLLDRVPHGTGDFIGALFTGLLLNGRTPQQALHLAAAGVHAVATRSQGLAELVIVANPDDWITPIPLSP